MSATAAWGTRALRAASCPDGDENGKDSVPTLEPRTNFSYQPNFGALRPVNTLGGRGASSQAKPIRMHSSAIPNPKAFNFRAHDSDDDRPSKRQRIEGSHAGSSRTSPLEIEGSQSKSISAPSEISSSQDSLTLIGSKRARVHEDGMVSTSTEYRSVEGLVQDQKQKPKRRPNKRQCTGGNGVSSNSSVISGGNSVTHFNRAQSQSLDLRGDSIESQSPRSPYKGTARPNRETSQKIEQAKQTIVTQSSHFLKTSKSTAASVSNSKKSGNRNLSAVDPIDDDADELAEGHSMPLSKQDGARLAGNNLFLANFKKPAQNDIQRTNFKPTRANARLKTNAKSSMPSKSNINLKTFELTAFVVASSDWELRKGSESWSLVPETPADGNTIFKPYKGGISMAAEERELVIYPGNLINITFAADSEKIIIRRRVTGDQKMTNLSIKLSLHEAPGYFVQILQKINPDIKVKTTDW